MSESEIFVCSQCGKEHEALTQETASYSCPNALKSKTKLKVLDCVSINLLTELINSSETQASKQTPAQANGDTHEREKVTTFNTDRDACSDGNKDADRSTSGESE